MVSPEEFFLIDLRNGWNFEREKKTKDQRKKEKGKAEGSETGMREEGVIAQPEKENAKTCTF
ncbi:MAG: hypothetical protein PF570_06840 [Candidatus Cloacimonetes bacterium]|jgi:hypothetical protein|nr:hypothetical protein [Candidatus Cloacimonadota bacterium]